MSWKICKRIKNYFRCMCRVKCCETELDCENITNLEENEKKRLEAIKRKTLDRPLKEYMD